MRITLNCLFSIKELYIALQLFCNNNSGVLPQRFENLNRKFNNRLNFLYHDTAPFTQLHHQICVWFYSILWQHWPKTKCQSWNILCTGHILPNAIISIFQNWKFDRITFLIYWSHSEQGDSSTWSNSTTLYKHNRGARIFNKISIFTESAPLILLTDLITSNITHELFSLSS